MSTWFAGINPDFIIYNKPSMESRDFFRNTSLFVKPDKNSYNNPIQYTENPLLSGYISKQNLDSLSQTVPLKIRGLGRGSIIGFTKGPKTILILGPFGMAPTNY